MMKREIFKIEQDKIIRLRRNCPKCGEGIFLAEHKDRLSCGKCGYTEFKGKKDKKPEMSVEEEKPEESTEKPIKEETVEGHAEETQVETAEKSD